MTSETEQVKKDGADCATAKITGALECWMFINGNLCEECGQRLPQEEEGDEEEGADEEKGKDKKKKKGDKKKKGKNDKKKPTKDEKK